MRLFLHDNLRERIKSNQNEMTEMLSKEKEKFFCHFKCEDEKMLVLKMTHRDT